MKINQVKIGVILSYVLMILNALFGFVVTPIIIKYVGSGDYGVYKTISSLTSSVLVLDLGLGETTIRYIAKYCVNNEKDKIPNFLAMMCIIATFVCILVSIVCITLSFCIKPIYENSFTDEQLSLAFKIFILTSSNIIVQIISNVFNGTISGFNRFAFSHSLSILKILLRIIIGLIVICLTKNIILFVLVDLLIGVLIVIVECIYIKSCLKISIHLSNWDKSLFVESCKFSIFMFLIAVSSQICSNLDNIVIGALCGPQYVTIYSIALLIFVMFGNISCAISGVMLPTVTNILKKENYEEEIVRLLIKTGRLQFMFLSACIIGFFVLGKDFIYLWLGDGYEDVYILTLILIVPSIFEYCINVALSILKAKNMMGYRTFSLVLSCMVNLIITIVLVNYWSYIGAAIGTAITYFMCSLIMMNIYYKKKLNLPILHIYKCIVSKIWICVLFSGIVLFVYHKFVFGTIWSLIGGILLFCIVYSLLLILFGFNKEEKNSLPILRNIIKKEK